MVIRTKPAMDIYFNLRSILESLGESPYGRSKFYQEDSIKIICKDLMGPYCIEILVDGEWTLVFAYDVVADLAMVYRVGKWIQYVQGPLLDKALTAKQESESEREELSDRKMPERFDPIDDASVFDALLISSFIPSYGKEL